MMMLFQALSLATLSLYDFLLRSYITGKLRTQYIKFNQIPPCSSWYTKTQLPWTSNNSSCLLWQDFCVVTQKSRIGCRSRTTQRHPRRVTAGHSWALPLKTSPIQNHSFDLCVQHHAYAGVTTWLLKTKALFEHGCPRDEPPISLCEDCPLISWRGVSNQMASTQTGSSLSPVQMFNYAQKRTWKLNSCSGLCHSWWSSACNNCDEAISVTSYLIFCVTERSVNQSVVRDDVWVARNV